MGPLRRATRRAISWRSTMPASELLARTPVRLALCMAAGASMALATPPMDVYPMAWLGMVALAWVFTHEQQRSPGGEPMPMLLRLSTLAFVFGVGTNLVALRFIPAVVGRFTTLPPFL